MYDPERDKPLGLIYKATAGAVAGGLALVGVEALFWQASVDEYTKYEAVSTVRDMGLVPLPGGFRYESPVLFGLGVCGLDDYAVVKIDVQGPDGHPRSADVCFDTDGPTKVILGETNRGNF